MSRAAKKKKKKKYLFYLYRRNVKCVFTAEWMMYLRGMRVYVDAKICYVFPSYDSQVTIAADNKGTPGWTIGPVRAVGKLVGH
jgi:hypothetical protein